MTLASYSLGLVPSAWGSYHPLQLYLEKGRSLCSLVKRDVCWPKYPPNIPQNKVLPYFPDFDECTVYGTCSQTCTNVEGSYTCSCVEGYLLQPDNRSCKAKNGENHDRRSRLICSPWPPALCVPLPLVLHFCCHLLGLHIPLLFCLELLPHCSRRLCVPCHDHPCSLFSLPEPVDRPPVLLIANSQNILATYLSGAPVPNITPTSAKQTTAMDFNYVEDTVCWVHVGDSASQTVLKCAKIPNLKGFVEERSINISLSLHRECCSLLDLAPLVPIRSIPRQEWSLVGGSFPQRPQHKRSFWLSFPLLLIVSSKVCGCFGRGEPMR